MSNIQPNNYTLESNPGFPFSKVAYKRRGFDGQPVLALTLGSPTAAARVFTGSQIRTVNTEIGVLVSVTTDMTIDTGSKSFSVLIPAITITGLGNQVAFQTDAILVAHSGPNSVPTIGVHEVYQFTPLKGHADLVLVPLEAAQPAVA